MRHHVNIVLGVLAAGVALVPISASIAQTNWREVRAIKMGRFYSRVEVCRPVIPSGFTHSSILRG